MENYIFAFAGMFLYLLLDLYGLQESTPDLTFIEVIKEYFKKNIIPIIAGTIILFLIINLSISGDTGFLQSLGINITAGKGGALLIGLTSQTLLTAVRRIIQPMEVMTRGDKVQEVGKPI